LLALAAGLLLAPWIPVLGQSYEVLSSGRSAEDVLAILTERLDLNENQVNEIRIILEEGEKKRVGLKEKYSADDSTDEMSLLIETRRLIKSTEKRITAVLSEEQAVRYAQLHDEYLANAQKEARSKITDEMILHMKERLELTEEQADLVLPILDEDMRARRELMEKYRGETRGGPGGGPPSGRGGGMAGGSEMRAEMERLDERTESRLAKVLTEEQMEEYRKMKEEQRRMMRDRMRNRGSGGPGGRGGGGGRPF
jgi:hypothetical protein